jgi:hypothetical protein
MKTISALKHPLSTCDRCAQAFRCRCIVGEREGDTVGVPVVGAVVGDCDGHGVVGDDDGDREGAPDGEAVPGITAAKSASDSAREYTRMSRTTPMKPGTHTSFHLPPPMYAYL